MLRRRLVTGPLLILGLIGIVVLDELLADRNGVSGIAFTALTAGILIPLAGIEAAGLLRATGVRAGVLATVFGAESVLLCTLAATMFTDPMTATGMVLMGPFLAMIGASIHIARSRSVEGGFTAVAGMVTSGLWLGLGLGFWLLVARHAGAMTAAGLLMVVKAGDIGAYFTGMSLGRRKLIPWLSPGKTVEGGIGALLWGGGAGAGLAWATEVIGIPSGIIGGVFLAASGAVGDLLESLLKRQAGAKDSGSLLPGMGGMLDVLDSPLLAGPIAWLIVVFAG